MALALVAGGLCCAQAAHAVPSFDEVRRDYRPSDLRVLDRQGELLQRLRTDATVRRGEWTALADISPALRSALLMSEDRRFYEHSGVDWRAVTAAAWGNLWNSRTRGASTITMQLAGLLDEDLKRGGSRGLVQKMGQAVGAEQLERGWRKDQILEAYLNSVPFRGEIVGIDALSRTLFGKAPQGLDARESALAAALVRSPNAGRAAVARRACELLRQMEPEQRPDCLALDLFAEAALRRRAFAAGEGIAPHLARQAQRQAGANASPVRTTVSAPLQRLASLALERQLRELRGRHVQDGAVLVLDNRSGEVLAWVGSSGAISESPEVDGVLARRQPGSTLKPFLYGQAIAERRLTAASLVLDSPEQIPTAGGLYVPQNYDRRFKGDVSVRTALAASLNVPAVRTLVMVGPDAFFAQLRAAGIELPESGGYYGYSLALGSPEVSLLQLTNAYRMLANGGMVSPTRLLAGQPAPAGPTAPRALDAGAAFIVGDMLSDPDARSRTFGTDSLLATRFWTAVKTGTSKDMRDNWAVGWSQRYTVGVWVGNAGGDAMWDVSGVSGAAPVWAEVMAWLHRDTPSRAPAAPPGVQRRAIRFGAGLEAPRGEWFLAGTAQPVFERADSDGDAPADTNPPRILEPAAGTIVALDPDIPPRHQRIWLVAAQAGARWRIDGKPAGQGARLAWMPWPGRHRIALVDADGRERDAVSIEVRGAGVRSGKPR
ncbi:penicillin-binding protein 1C [Xylophilus sp. GOD-11R]|uniref:penicillin-binding protein 1C n=1 Tax=Xylophilus sp. GOD-11R TaxID=3089814 RepID=UPI00399A40C5